MEQYRQSAVSAGAASQHLEHAFDAAGIGFWEVDFSTGHIARSIIHDRIFGYRGAQIEWDLSCWYDHIVFNDRDEFAAKLAAAKLQGSLNAECRIQRLDGAVRWVALTAATHDDTTSARRLLTGIIVDITDNKRREQEPYLVAPARDTDFADSIFITKMSHEIRTPLHAIQGFNFLLQKTPLSPNQSEYAAKTDAAAQTLLSILDAIADFSKIEMGALKLDTIDFRLDQLLDEVAARLTPACEAKGLGFSLIIGPDVPHNLRGDSRRLQQILMSLGNHAIGSAHRGEIAISVLLLPPDEYTEDNRVSLYFSVRDTGLGLNGAQMAHAIDAFARPDNIHSRARNAGNIGLAVSKKLIEMLGGTLVLNAKPGQGSNFNFNLTLGTGLNENLTAFAGEPMYQRRKIAETRVLLVDDDNLNLQVGRAILGYIGVHQIDTADNGLEAVNLVEQHGGTYYQLVLMDLQMPVMDGYVAAREIRRRPGGEELPIVAMTADISADSENCFIAGMSEFITKPISIPQLTQILSRRLGIEIPK
ncbi:MAG TPA: response regulator [Spongiibacteraceae bacterium]